MINIETKQQYMETLRERYLKDSKKEKGEILVKEKIAPLFVANGAIFKN